MVLNLSNYCSCSDILICTDLECNGVVILSASPITFLSPKTLDLWCPGKTTGNRPGYHCCCHHNTKVPSILLNDSGCPKTQATSVLFSLSTGTEFMVITVFRRGMVNPYLKSKVLSSTPSTWWCTCRFGLQKVTLWPWPRLICESLGTAEASNSKGISSASGPKAILCCVTILEPKHNKPIGSAAWRTINWRSAVWLLKKTRVPDCRS